MFGQIWLPEREQYVGSSTQLAARVANYKEDIALKKLRPVIANMTKFGIENFKLTVYVVDKVQDKSN
jgi:hypothetical protein